MAIDINIAIFLSISILVLGILGLLRSERLFVLFPFMGAIMGIIIYEYLAGDGNIAVSGTNYSDYPFILVPLFMVFVDFGLCWFKVSGMSKFADFIFLLFVLAGVDGYFVPTAISGLATTPNPNLPGVMLGFVQNYGEVVTVGTSAVLAIYALYSLWIK